MSDLHLDRWYRLIGGQRVRVGSVDPESGMIEVRDDQGGMLRLTRSAFVGAEIEPEPDATGEPKPAEPADDAEPDMVATLRQASEAPEEVPEEEVFDPLRAEFEAPSLAEPEPVLEPVLEADGEIGEAGDAPPFTVDDEPYVTEDAPRPETTPENGGDPAVAADVEQAEAGYEDDEDGGTSETTESVDDVEDEAGGIQPEPDATLPGRVDETTATVDDTSPGRAEPLPRMAETRELDLDDPNVEPEHAVTGQGILSPLMLGVLLGMIVLAGVVIWIVLHSRIDDLEQQFTRLDERFQVMAADVGRQGDALRQYLADPDATNDKGVSLSGRQDAVESRTEALARSQAEMRLQLDAFAADLKDFDGRFAGLDKRLDSAEKVAALPAPTVTPTKTPPKPASSPAPATRPTPPEPPAGYSVILASLPVRGQAMQELDRLRARGLEVVLREARVKNGTWYRIQAEGFITRDAAKAFAREAESRHGVAGAWVAAP